MRTEYLWAVVSWQEESKPAIERAIDCEQKMKSA